MARDQEILRRLDELRGDVDALTGEKMAEDAEGLTLEIDAAHKTAKVSGKQVAEVIAVLSLVTVMWMGWVLYTHSTEARAGVDRLNDALERMVQAQTQATCLLGFKESERAERRQWCEDIARASRPR